MACPKTVKAAIPLPVALFMQASGARAWFAEEDKTGLVLERSESNKTGFLDVGKVRGGYQVKAWDAKLKRARGLPGVWSTAEEAAQLLACAKRKGLQLCMVL